MAKSKNFKENFQIVARSNNHYYKNPKHRASLLSTWFWFKVW